MISSAISPAYAIEEILDGFNVIYGTHDTRLDTCDLCHIVDKPLRNTCHSCHGPGNPKTPSKHETDTNLNPYGMKLEENIDMEMEQAFLTLEDLDLDADGFTTIEEIHELKFPGDSEDKPPKKPKKNISLVKSFDFDKIIDLIFN